MASSIRDSDWLRHAFLVPINEDYGQGGTSGDARKYTTTASMKFTNASFGGNWAINNPPQFTRFADIRQPGKGRSEQQRNEGMGRYYSEAIDDTGQNVHLSFGVPRYNSWVNFFLNFYNRNAALMANTGRSSTVSYNFGFVGGFLVTLPLQPFLVGLSAANNVINFLTKSSPSKWYYFKPTMHNYWSAVNTIANEMAVNMGIVPRIYGAGQEDMRPSNDTTTNADKIAEMHRLYPDIFREEGGIDVMALANRTQRMSDYAQLALQRMTEAADNVADVRDLARQYSEDFVKDPGMLHSSSREYFQAYMASDARENEGAGMTDSFSTWADLEGIYSFIRASQRDGSQFATFRVNNPGTMTESFSNSTRESDIASKVNSMSNKGRALTFDTMAGNAIPGMGSIIDAVQGVIAGAADSVSLGGLATLTGTAIVDVPKYWEASTANLPRTEYTVSLPCPYGNKMSRYLNLMVPISMLLAGALPLSAGRSSYTSPFLCQIYHQGRCQVQLGMIDSLTITRGTGNVGWNAENEMLGAELTFSVVDMSSIMSVPIKAGFYSGNIATTALKGATAQVGTAIAGDGGAAVALALTDASAWDEGSSFSDYMAVLSSMSLGDSYYVGRKLSLNLTKTLQTFKTWKSPSNFMSWGLDSGLARTLSGFAQYSGRIN